MKTFLLQNPKRILAIAGLASICGLFGTASAQTHPERVYANSEGWKTSGVTLGIQPSVTGPENAISANLKDSSDLFTGSGLLSLLPSLTQYLQFPTAIPANTQVHIKLSFPAGLLNVASLLGNVEIGTYSGLSSSGAGGGATATTKTKLYDNSSSGGLVNLLNGNGTNDLIITVPAQCDGIYINLNALASALSVVSTRMSIFHAYYINPAAVGDAGCPTPIDVLSGVAATTGIGAVANALGSVDGVWNAIDNDPTLSTYATLNVGVSAISRTYLAAMLNVPAKANDSVSIVLQDPGNGVLNLLSAQVLNSLSVQPYMDNTPVGSAIPINNSGLIHLTLFPSENSKGTITFPVTAGNFNKVEIRFTGLASVAQGIRVFDVKVKVPAPHGAAGVTNSNQYAYVGNNVTLAATANANGDAIVWYSNPDGTGVVTNPISGLVAGAYTYYARSSRDGCTDASGNDTLNLHVVTPSNPPLPAGNVGTPYSQQVTIDAPTSGLPNTPTYTYSFVSSTFNPVVLGPSQTSVMNLYAMTDISAAFASGPMNIGQMALFAPSDLTNGLSYNDATNTIEGTPGAEGTYHVTFSAFDNANNLDAGTFTKDITIGAALPVTLTNFDVNLDANKNAVVTWSTESEQGSIRFDVLRSNDGTNFSTIGSVDAAGISTNTRNYRFVDNNPGAKSYYQLSIVKNDGIKTSNIVSITGGRVAGFSINPNPASNDITITGLNDIKSVSIYDASGRLVKTATNNHINVRSLSQGIYFVTVVTKDGNKTNGKFIKK